MFLEIQHGAEEENEEIRHLLNLALSQTYSEHVDLRIYCANTTKIEYQVDLMWKKYL